MKLVYFSPVPWESFAQRPHKFVEWFHSRTGAPVLWIDPYPTRLPYWRDFSAARPKAVLGDKRSSPSWLVLERPRAFPIEPIPCLELLNRFLWRNIFSKIKNFARDSEVFIAIGKPSSLALRSLKLLSSHRSLYDAMDDFPAFYSGMSRHSMAKKELAIAARVTTIWGSSTALLSRWKHLREDVRLVLNGLDGSAVESVERKSEHRNHKVFGYVGTIGSWFDWEFVSTLASLRPLDEVRIIGPVFQAPSSELPPNVSLLPACDHSSAIGAMTEFDAGLIPFKQNFLTASVDPIKYYEYRALGLPIISTNFGEMINRQKESGVFIVRSTDELLGATNSASRFLDIDADIAKFISRNTWEARFNAARLFS